MRFLSNNTDVAPKSREKLLQLVHMQPSTLQIELAGNYDAGEPFGKATYTLEGDGPLALKCYKVIGGVKPAVQVHHRPNTAAIAKKVANHQHSEQSWIQYAANCVQPGLGYFTAKFDGDLKPVVNAFKSARMFDPRKLIHLKPDAAAVDTLRSFKFLDSDEIIRNLKSDVPTYLAADGVALTVDPLVWWERHAELLPHWAKHARKYFCVNHPQVLSRGCSRF